MLLLLSLTEATPEQVSLGRRLFFEKRLSSDGSIACATCHNPDRAYTEDRAVSIGAFGRRGTRNAPTLIGRGLGRLQFWDGRAASLREQVIEPIRNPLEMDVPVEKAVERLQSDEAYRGLTIDSLATALSAYVNTIGSGNSRLDRYLGGDSGALNAIEQEGLRLFRDRARCYICHSGYELTDEQFHNTGAAWRADKLADEGRGKVSGKAYDVGAFKTPTLREIARTAPYMHDGSLATLEEVIDYYDRGGNRNPHLDENLLPLNLSAGDKKALLAFLHALSGTVREGH